VSLRPYVYPIVAIVALTGLAGSQLAAPIQAVMPVDSVAWVIERERSLVERFVIDVHGDQARGWIALPKDGQPTALVVLCHAFGGNAADFHDFMEELAKDGVAVVAMDYRGPVGSFNIEAGVEDTMAATSYVLADHPSIQTTIIYGFSMGGAVAGVTVATMPPGTFDYWISGAGVADLSAMWMNVEFFRPLIEDETGGTPSESRAAYLERSPVALVDQIASVNLTAAVLVHAHADPVVPFVQAQELHAQLAAARVPALLIAVGGSDAPWACPALDPACAANPWATLDSHMVGHIPTMKPLLFALLKDDWSPPTGRHEVEAEDREGLLRLLP
jgi:pimeloyl-ACP methyl ester carboxylesterase